MFGVGMTNYMRFTLTVAFRRVRKLRMCVSSLRYISPLVCMFEKRQMVVMKFDISEFY